MRSTFFSLILVLVFHAPLFATDPTTPSISPLATPSPGISVSSLIIPETDPQKVSNWEAVRTCAEMCVLAYLPDEEGESKAKVLGFKTVNVRNVDNIHAIIASTDEVVLIAFRGTRDGKEGEADWATDKDIGMYSWRGGYVHKGFYDATAKILNLAIHDIEKIHEGANKKICVTGHSLGGAVAMLFSLWCKMDRRLNITAVTTFGQPLPVNRSLAIEMNKQFGHQYRRFVNGWDPITHVLPVRFWHSGGRVHFGRVLTVVPPFISPYRAVQGEFGEVETGGDSEAMSQSEFDHFQAVLRGEVEQSHCCWCKRKKKRRFKQCCFSCTVSPSLPAASPLGSIYDWTIEKITIEHSMHTYISKIEYFGFPSSVK